MQRLEPDQVEAQVFPLVRRGYDTDKVDAFLRVVAAYYREALRAAEEIPEHAPRPDEAFQQIGDQIASMLSAAALAANDLKVRAARETEMIRAEALEEANQTAAEARRQLAAAEEATIDAAEEAERLVTGARAEADDMLREARQRIARLERDAQDRIEQLGEAAEANLAAIAALARKRYEELRRIQQQSAAGLRSVETVVRQARENLEAEGMTISLAAFIANGSVPAGEPGGATGARPAAPGPREAKRANARHHNG